MFSQAKTARKMAQVKVRPLVSFLARPKPRIPFLGLSLLRNQTETLATQVNNLQAVKVSDHPTTRKSGRLFPLTGRHCSFHFKSMT